MRKLFSTTLLLASIAFVSVANAQEKKPVATTAEELTNMVMSMCPQMVSQIMTGKELMLVARDRPINAAGICSCTETHFRSDKRLEDQFNVGLFTLNEKMKSDNLRAYFTVRLMSSVFACIATDMDRMLLEVDPSK